MYITFGHERAAQLVRPERSLLDDRVKVVIGEVARVHDGQRTVELSDGRMLGYEYLVLATGSRIVPEEIPYFAEEAHHFYTAEAAERLRAALDAFDGGKIVIGIAGLPYKSPPPRPSCCPRPGAPSSSSPGVWPSPPAAGCRPTGRPSRSAGGRTCTPSATPRTCPSPRLARPPISRRPWWPSGSRPRCRGASRRPRRPPTPAA